MNYKRKKKARIFQKIVIGFIILIVTFVFDFWLFMPKQKIAETTKNEEINSKIELETELKDDNLIQLKDKDNLENDIIEEENNSEKYILPDRVEIENVPFLSQAPFAEWDDLHNEACEEATLIMAKYWLEKKPLDKETGDKEILDSVAWQEQNWGGHYDLSVEDIKNLGINYFGLIKIYYTAIEGIDDIKRELSEGNLVIVPTAGRLLNNPYYKQPGPAYHALVLKGYQDDKIIANDPGTKRGENYIYDQNVLLNAIYDWPLGLGEGHEFDNDKKASEVLKGKKIMIVVEK